MTQPVLKRVYITTAAILVAGLTLSTPQLWAAEHDHESDVSTTENADSSGGMDMSKLQDMKEKMHEQMQEISKTDDPEKRQALLDEHMKSMQDMMTTMHQADGMKDDQGMMKEGKGMMEHRKMMMQRMDSMQAMMEQMLEHQNQAAETQKLLQNKHKKQ